jgi:hypothetical protein
LGAKLIDGGKLTNDAVVPIIVVYFFALSFLGVYLVTRLYLTFAFQQTLVMLTTSGGAAASLEDLVGTLDAAALSGTPDALNKAAATYLSWSFGPGEKDAALLNASIARVLAKLIAGGQTTGPLGDNTAVLRQAVSKAAIDPTIRGQLKANVASGVLTTGNKSLDAEIASGLA